jgi:hypothetical protein
MEFDLLTPQISCGPTNNDQLKVAGKFGNNSFIPSVTQIDTYINPLENGWISPGGTITMNGSPPNPTVPLSIELAINGSPTIHNVEETHNSLYIPR